jgi:acyl-CoA synthetase (AMP-forming)/AMP-acid ligase II
MFTPLTPIRCLYRAVDLYGHKEAVVCGQHRFTYAQFGERCERLAAALLAAGIAGRDRVAYLSFNTHKLLEGYFGVVQAGAIVMPLNVRLTPAELTAILQHSGARVLFFEEDFAGLVPALRAACPKLETVISLENGYEPFIASAAPKRTNIDTIAENSIGSDALAPDVIPARALCGRHLRAGRYRRSAAHDPAVPCQWVGMPASDNHHGRQTLDGAAVRSGDGLPADSD